MFTKILVAIDHSAAKQKVFDAALSLAQALPANLLLLHVLSTEEEDSPPLGTYLAHHKNRILHVDPQIMRMADELYEEEWEVYQQKGRELLDFFVNQAAAAGIQAESKQVTGHPSSAICDVAHSCQADVIVIGRRGYSGLKEMFLGSVSNYVVHHAPCSILLVQTYIAESESTEEDEEDIESMETNASA